MAAITVLVDKPPPWIALAFPALLYVCYVRAAAMAFAPKSGDAESASPADWR